MDKKREPIIDILIYQVIISVLAIIAVIVFKFMPGQSYDVIKKFYKEEMLDKTTIKEVMSDYEKDISSEY